jgi:hypothetical protein
VNDERLDLKRIVGGQVASGQLASMACSRATQTSLKRIITLTRGASRPDPSALAWFPLASRLGTRHHRARSIAQRYATGDEKRSSMDDGRAVAAAGRAESIGLSAIRCETGIAAFAAQGLESCGSRGPLVEPQPARTIQSIALDRRPSAPRSAPRGRRPAGAPRASPALGGSRPIAAGRPAPRDARSSFPKFRSVCIVASPSPRKVAETGREPSCRP